eukprot:COSAG02_NODE_1111_length_14509_cov_3.543303_11_plen_647_part_00
MHTLARKRSPYLRVDQPMTRLVYPTGSPRTTEDLPTVEFSAHRFYCTERDATEVEVTLLQRQPIKAALPGARAAVRIIIVPPTAPEQQDHPSDDMVIDPDLVCLRSMHTSVNVYLKSGHKTVVRLCLVDHNSCVAGKFPANANTLALCRLQLEAVSVSVTDDPLQCTVGVSVGSVKTAVVYSANVDAWHSPPVALLDLPSHLLEQVLGNKCLSDRDIWGEHGIALTCHSVYDFVSREEFFASRYCSIWPWATRVARLPEQLPCHLRPAQPFATATLRLQSGGSTMYCDESKPMRSAYIHARLRDVAAGFESFPVVAIGWQISQRFEQRRHLESPDERLWINESAFSWCPCAAADEPGPFDGTIALPVEFEYTRGDPTLRPASVRHCNLSFSDNLVTQRRLVALATATACPPLLHLTHHIVDHSDDVVTFFNSRAGGVPHPNCRASIAEHTRPVAAVAVGQPCGWGVVLDESVPVDTILGEYVGVYHPTRTSSVESESDEDDDTANLSPRLTGTQVVARMVHKMRRQLDKHRKGMYILHLRNGGSIQPHKAGNWTRFINHSFAPNVRYEEWVLPTGEPPTRTVVDPLSPLSFSLRDFGCMIRSMVCGAGDYYGRECAPAVHSTRGYSFDPRACTWGGALCRLQCHPW